MDFPQRNYVITNKNGKIRSSLGSFIIETEPSDSLDNIVDICCSVISILTSNSHSCVTLRADSTLIMCIYLANLFIIKYIHVHIHIHLCVLMNIKLSVFSASWKPHIPQLSAIVELRPFVFSVARVNRNEMIFYYTILKYNSPVSISHM